MSSEDILDNEQIFDDLFRNKLYIAFIVHESQCYWVIDWDEHFNLDYSKHIEAVCNKPSSMMHLPKGLSVEQYRSNLYKNYRGGITKLTAENISEYLNLSSTLVTNVKSLKNLITSERLGNFQKLYESMELFSFLGKPALSQRERSSVRDIRTLLPTYYINFNRKIFMHMREHRFHETKIDDAWYGTKGDFEHMVPKKYRYWEISDQLDYWSINNFITL